MGREGMKKGKGESLAPDLRRLATPLSGIDFFWYQIVAAISSLFTMIGLPVESADDNNSTTIQVLFSVTEILAQKIRRTTLGQTA